MENYQVEELKAFIETLCDKNGKINEAIVGWSEFKDCQIGNYFDPNKDDIDTVVTTDRTMQELFFINQVCKKYSELLGVDRKLQYLEVGTYFGASVISACLMNSKITAFSIDLYEEIEIEGKKVSVLKFGNEFGKVYFDPQTLIENNIKWSGFIEHRISNNKYPYDIRDLWVRIKLIVRNSADIQDSDLIRNDFNEDQGIHVFFYDGCKDNETVINNTFINVIPLMSDVCVCIFNQNKKSDITKLFKDVIDDKYKRFEFTHLVNLSKKETETAPFHCYLLKKNP